jgi:hypothetical protein
MILGALSFCQRKYWIRVICASDTEAIDIRPQTEEREYPTRGVRKKTEKMNIKVKNLSNAPNPVIEESGVRSLTSSV